MGKYSSYSRQKPTKPRNVGVHPVMRGIGCIMIVVVPILAYGFAMILVNYGATRGWPIPSEWYGTPSIPAVLSRLQGLQPIIQFLKTQTNLEANLVFAFGLIILIGGLMSMLYGYIYTLFGPSKYGPMDAPPIRGVKVKRYKR
jgi:hypothetical protein